MSRARSRADALMVDPLPSIVRASVMSRSPLPATRAPGASAGPIVKVYVRLLPRMMRSAPGLRLVAIIASRSEQSGLQAPSLVSVVLLTTKSAAAARVLVRPKRPRATNRRPLALRRQRSARERGDLCSVMGLVSAWEDAFDRDAVVHDQ